MMSEEKLTKIQETLEDIKSLMLLVNQEKINEMKSKLLQPNSIEAHVYNLCDGENTTQDIATKTEKTTGNIRKVLSSLRQKGLVRTSEKNEKKIHEQIF